jgi:hypothetical protein
MSEATLVRYAAANAATLVVATSNAGMTEPRSEDLPSFCCTLMHHSIVAVERMLD